MGKGIHFKNIRIMTRIIFCLAVFLCWGIAFAQNSLTLEIAGVKKQGGKLYISFFNSEESFDKRKVCYSMETNATAETLLIPVSLSAGGYVISMYQDSNGNGRLDSNFLGIPREPFGFSNYNGKSAPGSFDKLKVMVNDKTKKVTVHLYKI
jgi:uncharacterized protein (DUF2141 family)